MFYQYGDAAFVGVVLAPISLNQVRNTLNTHLFQQALQY